MESTTKPNYITFMRNDRATATATTNPVATTVTNINKTNTYEQQSKNYHHNNNNNFNHLAHHNHNNHQHHQHYHHYHHHQVLSNTSGNNRKKFPTRTSSLYEISSLNKDLNNDYYDVNNDCDNDVYYHPMSSIIKSGNHHHHHHHQNNDSNYRILPSSYRTHRQYLLRDTEILPENYPLTDMTSIIERRSSSSVESEKETNTLLTTTKTTVTKENFRHNHNLNNTNTSILREKVYNNSENNEVIGNSNNYNNEYLLSSSSSSSWLRCDDIDSMKGKMKLKTTQQQQQQLLLNKSNSYQHHNCRRYDQKYSELIATNRNRYSESEKDAFNKTTNFDVDIDLSKTRRSEIRTRSESEPNDLCNMKYWVPNNNTESDIRDEKSSYRKSNNAQQSFIELEEKRQCSSYKLPPKCSSSSRKISTSSPPVTTPRVSIYSCSSRSPRIIRKSPSSRAQTTATAVTTQNSSQRSKSPNISSRINNNGCSSPRRHYSSNNSSAISMTRRCRTKSPSPTYNNKKYESIDGGTNSTGVFRKAKSVTPSTRKSEHYSTSSQSLPLSNETTSLKCSEKSSQSSVPPLRSAKHEFESDSNNDEDDINDDFEDDFNDDDDDDKQNSSSDSENGYRAHAYVSNFEKSSSTSSFQHSVNSNSILDATINYVPPSCPLVPSLFPNVPPYLAFSTDSEKGPQLPQQVHKILKWKLTTIMPKVVRRILINSGFRLLKKTNDWMGTWGKHMKSPCFRAIRPYQKVNHLPGSFKIGRKDSCWKNLQVQMLKHGKKEFGFMPKTYIIPQDLKMLRKSWPKYAQRNFKWIIKPPASARGTGIKVVNRWSQIPKRKSVIVQRYIERPFLINGSKFDLRLYVLVTSVNPLRVYLYHDGLVRFASVKYSEKSDTLSDRCMHLTNYSINKFSSNYAKNEDVHACHGHKWTIKSLWAFFEKRGVNTNRLWSAFRNLILRTLLAGESAINAMIKLNVESKYNCFELFGFDILLDSELVPWLLEVNISPSLHSELPLDLHVKAPLVQAVLNTALYHIPPKLSMDQQKDLLTRHELQGPLCFDKRLYITYLSRAEKIKHQQFTKKSLEDRDEYLHNILENLTPDDIRCLIITEDELSRSAPLERIFPTQHTHKYLKYTETPRYYNRLLDAWEHKYGKDRLAGINLLKELCQQNLHLDTPPVPMRRPIKIRTRTLMRRRILTKKSMMTKPSYWSIKIAAMKSTMNKMKRNNSIASNLQSQIQNSNSTATTSMQPTKQIETINPIVGTIETPLLSASTTALIHFQKQQQQQQQPQQQKQT